MGRVRLNGILRQKHDAWFLSRTLSHQRESQKHSPSSLCMFLLKSTAQNDYLKSVTSICWRNQRLYCSQDRTHHRITGDELCQYDFECGGCQFDGETNGSRHLRFTGVQMSGRWYRFMHNKRNTFSSLCDPPRATFVQWSIQLYKAEEAFLYYKLMHCFHLSRVNTLDNHQMSGVRSSCPETKSTSHFSYYCLLNPY